MNWPCWHVWKIIDKEVLPSLTEQWAVKGIEVRGYRGSDPGERPCIVTKYCEKCGSQKVERI